MSNARFGLRVRNGLVRVITEGASGIDVDAGAFINAAGITDLTQQTAIIQLVLDLKSYNLWNKFKAIYPFVGGTSAAHKFNLKDPRDLDAAFRLVFFGGWTHSATGALPNGTNAYADTFLVPLTQLINQDISLSYYSRTNSQPSNANTMGCDSNPSDWCRLVIRRATNTGYTVYGGSSGFNFYTISDSRGLFVANRLNSTTAQMFRNGSLLSGSIGSLGSSSVPNFKIVLGANNSIGSITEFDNKECAFSCIGESLGTTEASNLYNAVQNFQTTLGRQV